MIISINCIENIDIISWNKKIYQKKQPIVLKLIRLTQKSSRTRSRDSIQWIHPTAPGSPILPSTTSGKGDTIDSPTSHIIRTPSSRYLRWKNRLRRILTADIHQGDSNRINWTFTRLSPSQPRSSVDWSLAITMGVRVFSVRASPRWMHFSELRAFVHSLSLSRVIRRTWTIISSVLWVASGVTNIYLSRVKANHETSNKFPL